MKKRVYILFFVSIFMVGNLFSSKDSIKNKSTKEVYLKALVSLDTIYLYDSVSAIVYNVESVFEGIFLRKQIFLISGDSLNKVENSIILTLYKTDTTSDYGVFYLKNKISEQTERVRVVKLEHDYFKVCRHEKEACTPIVIEKNTEEKVFFSVFGGGSYSSFSLSDTSGIITEKRGVPYRETPFSFNLSELKDGEYSVSMFGCGLGGTVYIQLKTKD